MKLNTNSVARLAIALCFAAGTFLVTPALYARHPHTNLRIVREDRGNEEKGKKDSSRDKSNDSKDNSPDKGDR
jgi:hypothetical protein